LFIMFINDPRPDLVRLQDITDRIEAIPEFVRGTLDRLDTPIRHWVEMERQKVTALPQLLETLKNWARTEVADADYDRLDAACDRAEQAFTTYLDALLALPTTDDLAVGTQRAEAIVKARGVELELHTLHGIARDFLADTQATIETLRGQLAARYDLAPDIEASALHEWLNARFAVPPEGDDLSYVLRRYERERATILDYIQARDLFPVL